MNVMLPSRKHSHNHSSSMNRNPRIAKLNLCIIMVRIALHCACVCSPDFLLALSLAEGDQLPGSQPTLRAVQSAPDSFQDYRTPYVTPPPGIGHGTMTLDQFTSPTPTAPPHQQQLHWSQRPEDAGLDPSQLEAAHLEMAIQASKQDALRNTDIYVPTGNTDSWVH